MRNFETNDGDSQGHQPAPYQLSLSMIKKNAWCSTHSPTGGPTTASLNGSLDSSLDYDVQQYTENLATAARTLRSIADREAGGTLQLGLRECSAIGEADSRFFDTQNTSRSNLDFDDATGREMGPCGNLANFVATAYGAQAARFTTSGTSAINSDLGLILRLVFGREVSVLLDSGAHFSMIGGLSKAQIKVHLFHRQYCPELGVELPFSPGELEEVIANYPGVDAVILTSPTYDGGVSIDAAEYRSVCHRHGAKLIVDSAWGALFGLRADFPISPASFADMTMISLHKKGIGPSQTSVALFNDDALLSGFERCISLGSATTSPAFYMLKMAESELGFLFSECGKSCYSEAIRSAQAFSESLEKIPGVRKINFATLGAFQSDPFHLLFDTRMTRCTGYQIQAALRERCRWQVEMVTPTSVLILFSPRESNNWEQMATNFSQAIHSVDSKGVVNPLEPPFKALTAEPVVSPHDAVFSPSSCIEHLPLQEAIGRVSAQVLGAYPPGAATIVPGYRINEAAVDYLERARMAGSRLKGEISKGQVAVLSKDQLIKLTGKDRP